MPVFDYSAVVFWSVYVIKNTNDCYITTESCYTGIVYKWNLTAYFSVLRSCRAHSFQGAVYPPDVNFPWENANFDLEIAFPSLILGSLSLAFALLLYGYKQFFLLHRHCWSHFGCLVGSRTPCRRPLPSQDNTRKAVYVSAGVVAKQWALRILSVCL
jgi:hypothetical protein